MLSTQNTQLHAEATNKDALIQHLNSQLVNQQEEIARCFKAMEKQFQRMKIKEGQII